MLSDYTPFFLYSAIAAAGVILTLVSGASPMPLVGTIAIAVLLASLGWLGYVAAAWVILIAVVMLGFVTALLSM